MKTQMEYPLIMLVVLVVLVILWNIWSGTQVDLSVASLNATIAGTEAPAPLMMAGEWVVKALVSLLFGGVATAGATALIVWARKQWRLQNTEQKKWQIGPNANWTRQPQPKPLGEAEMMRMMLMQQMGLGKAPSSVYQQDNMPPTLTRMDDDEPTILEVFLNNASF